MKRREKNERGVALIMVLLVVTLLTILVIEFTYTIQVESHISRNSLNSLQATFLARSGINIMAGALIKDSDRTVDPGEEDEWRFFALGPCQNLLENLEQNGSVPPTWQLCGRIVDESGKMNVNLSRPGSPAPNQTPTSGQSAPVKECNPKSPSTQPYCWRDVLGKLASGAGVDATAITQELDAYWASGQQATKLGQASQALAPEFGSLEEVAAAFPAMQSRTIFDGLRRYVTAMPIGGSRIQNRKLNINTVPAPVLRAILQVTENDEAVAGDIVAQRIEQPYKNVGEAFASVENKAGLANMFGTTSNVFRLEASASVNGVGKTVRALVLREQAPAPRGAPQGTIGWRLTYIDWQKESGIGAAREVPDGSEGLEPDDNSDKDSG